MTDIGFKPYPRGNGPGPGSVPLSVVILAKDEEANIAQCLASVTWAQQIIVVDSGSTDQTVEVARRSGAEIHETGWRGYGPQREYALRLEAVRHEWVFFVDADEWVSDALASEIRDVLLQSPAVDAFRCNFRLIFLGEWIRHCGWYPSAPIIRLMRRNKACYPASKFSEHPTISGQVGTLRCDIVDDDQKGFSSWLNKHVRYAELEARRRLTNESIVRGSGEPILRYILRTRIAPRVPGRPIVQFIYMYFLRAGFLDGRQGLTFCLLHAWFQLIVDVNVRHEIQARGREAKLPE